MKRIVITSLIIALVISLILWPAVPVAAADSAGGQGSVGNMTFTFNAGAYTMAKDKDGLDVIQMADFSSTTSPGDPMLPYTIYNIVVPPDVVWSSLKLNIVSAKTRVLEGTYDIKPAPSILPMADDGNGQLKEGWGEGKDIVNGRNMKVYGTDANFPASYLKLLPYSQMRKWKLTRVDFSPFQYNPVSKKLTLIQSVTVEISCQQSQVKPPASLMADKSMDDLAPKMFLNYQQAKGLYEAEAVAGPQPTTYDYVIITTNAIQSGSTKLASFITHKQNKGYKVLVVTETQWGAVTGQSPNHKAEKIRKWLQDNYASYGIQYVLLIGNPFPYESGEGDIPMKMCHPEMNQTEYPDCAATPTDYFYADLTGNWDIDGDQNYGEWSHDYPATGGVDFTPEVYVGRIPVYGADYITLDNILQKIIDYETESNIAWRKSALLPMSFSDASTDGARLAEQMKANYLDTAGFSSWRMYQQGSGACGLNSTYTSEQELRGGTVVRDRWAANDYGIVCWWGHGNATSAVVGYGGCWDGTLFDTSGCSWLDDNHPSFTYQCSCTNGYPENNGNLQYAILKQGGIGTVSATRDSWYFSGQTDFVNSPSNAGIGYEYTKRLVANNLAGQALYSAKQSMNPNHQCLLMNWYDFNIYGDPTTSLASGGIGGTTLDRQVGASSDDALAWWQNSAWQWNIAESQWVGDAGDGRSKAGGGMRFTNVTIPQGSTITTAYLTFRARTTRTQTPIYSKIRGEAADNAAQFSDYANYSGRARTTAQVLWNDIPAWTAGNDYNSPEIKTVIQEIVNRAGWAAGNALVIFWDDHDGNTSAGIRHAQSYNMDATNAPKLHIEYSTGGGTTLDRQVGASSDDALAWWQNSAWQWNIAESQWVGDAGDGRSKAGGGMRFTNVTIPQGSTITTAYLTFRARTTRTQTPIYSKIRGEAADNAAQFSDYANYSGRARTTAQVLWNDIPAWTAGNDYNSPEIKTVIQEIVNRAGWAAGNALVIFWDDHDGNTSAGIRHAQSYNMDATNAPKLHIEYSGEAPEPPPPPTPLSPGTAITFKWNASSGATKYLLQVNTAPDFTGTDKFNAEVGDVTTYELTGLAIGTTY